MLLLLETREPANRDDKQRKKIQNTIDYIIILFSYCLYTFIYILYLFSHQKNIRRKA